MTVLPRLKFLPVNYRMYLSVFLGYILMVITGLTSVWASPMLKKLQDATTSPLERELTEDESGWIVSLMIPGYVSGSFLVSIISQFMGKRPLLTIVGTLPLISFLTFAFTANIYVFYAAQIVNGIFNGAVASMLILYISEIAEPSQRGRICTAGQPLMFIGSNLTYCLGPFMSFKSYHLIFMALPIIFLIVFPIFAEETPYYYLQLKDTDTAKKVLEKLRGRDVTKEFDEMLKTSEKNENDTTDDGGSMFDAFKTTAAKRAIFISVGVATFQAMSANMVVSLYLQYICELAGGDWKPEYEAICVALFQTVMSLFVMKVVDSFNRKTMLIVSHLGMCFSLAGLGTYLQLKRSNVDVGSFSWFPLACLLGYILSLTIGVAPLAMTVMSELLPGKIKSITFSLIITYSSAIAFVLTLLFPKLEKSIGLGAVCLILAPFGILASIFHWFFLFETRGKTLDEIQNELDKGKK